MISKLLFFPRKIFKTFLVQILALFLITGTLLITINGVKTGVELRYKHMQANTLFCDGLGEEFNSQYPQECDKKAKQYSSLMNNKVTNYYPYKLNSIKLELPKNNNSSIKVKVSVVVCDDLSSFINFYHNVSSEVYISSSNNEGIYISYDLYEKYQPKDWSYKYSFYNEDIEDIEEVKIPIKGVYNSQKAENFTNFIYMSFDLYNSLSSKIGDFSYSGCIYHFEKDISQKQINQISKTNNSYLRAKTIEVNAYLSPFEKIIDCSYILLGLSIIVLEISLSFLIIQKNLKNREIDRINELFYMNKKNILIKTILRNLILIICSTLISYLLLLIITIIIYICSKNIVLPSIYVLYLGIMSYFILTITDITSRTIIRKSLPLKY